MLPASSDVARPSFWIRLHAAALVLAFGSRLANIGEPFVAMSMHLHVISTQISQMPQIMRFGSAAVLIALILFINSFAIVLRVWLRGRKRW